MEDLKQVRALIFLVLGTVFVWAIAMGDTDPFPINPQTAAYMEYAVNPFDHRNYTVTDNEAILTVIDSLNDIERRAAEGRERSCDPMEKQYHLRFYGANGSAWSLEVWQDRVRLIYGPKNRNSVWMADCGELNAVLEEIWTAQKAGEIE